MGTKNNPSEFDCYANALPDEPMFHLLGRDAQAPNLVRAWADLRELEIKLGSRPKSDTDMVKEARVVADSMEQWRKEHDGEWRVEQPPVHETLDRE
jgi:hypothetical protein